MFPPLCFIDVTRGLTSVETDKELKKVISSKDVESITAFKQETSKTEVVAKAKENNKKNTGSSIINKGTGSTNTTKSLQPSVELRFKSIEMLKSTFERLVSMF